MIRFIALTGGYVESSTVALLVFGIIPRESKPKFTSEQSALTELALDLFHKYYEDYLDVYRNRYLFLKQDCCLQTIIKHRHSLKGQVLVCSACQSEIKDKEFSGSQFMNWIIKLFSATSENYGSDEWANDRVLIWSPFWIEDFFGALKEDILYLIENAESEILKCLLEAKPELKPTEENQDKFYF